MWFPFFLRKRLLPVFLFRCADFGINNTYKQKKIASTIKNDHLQKKHCANKSQSTLTNTHTHTHKHKQFTGTHLRHIYFDSHLKPQLLFLLGVNGKPLNFSYIGYISNMAKTFPALIEKYLNVSEITVLEHFKHKRSRFDKEYGDPKYNLQYSQLSKQDFLIICELYVIDYMCFPFLMPSFCDQTYLFKRHIGKTIFLK